MPPTFSFYFCLFQVLTVCLSEDSTVQALYQWVTFNITEELVAVTLDLLSKNYFTPFVLVKSVQKTTYDFYPEEDKLFSIVLFTERL